MDNKTKFQKYKYFLWLLYIPAYFISFFALEKRNDVAFHYIHSSIDDSIPFCEYFIIPYYLWFAFIFVSVGLFIIYDFEADVILLSCWSYKFVPYNSCSISLYQTSGTAGQCTFYKRLCKTCFKP